MAAEKPRKWNASDTSAAVDKWMAALKHPEKPALELLRKIVRSADPAIQEGVKWNCPSFRTTEYFATTNLRVKDAAVAMILHRGAKKRATPAEFSIADPERLLHWLGEDRAMISFAGLADVRRRKDALQEIIRQWIGFLS